MKFRWTDHVAHIEAKEANTEFWQEDPKERDHKGDLEYMGGQLILQK